MKKELSSERIIWLVHIILFVLLLALGVTAYRMSEQPAFRSAFAGKDFLESETFRQQVAADMQDILQFARLADKFETGGELDLQKKVPAGTGKDGQPLNYSLQEALDYGRVIGATFDASQHLNIGSEGSGEGESGTGTGGTPQELNVPLMLAKAAVGDARVRQALLSLIYQLDEYYRLRRSLGQNISRNLVYRLARGGEVGAVILHGNTETVLKREKVLTYGRYFVLDSSSRIPESNLSPETVEELVQMVGDEKSVLTEPYEILLGIDTAFPEEDAYHSLALSYFRLSRLTSLWKTMGTCLLIGMLICVASLAFTGNKEGHNIDNWFTEFILLGEYLAFLIFFWGGEELLYGLETRSGLDVLTGLVLCAVTYFPIVFGILSLARRIRKHQFLEGFLLGRAIRGIRIGYATRNDRIHSGGQVLSLLAFLLLDAACAFAAGRLTADGWGWMGILLVAGMILLNAWYITRTSQKSNQVKWVFERIASLAAGDVGRPLDTEKLYGEVRRMAETVNLLDHSLEHAVNERTQSERMKTELIANVSHDLRTPLTSIINYVDLLKRENIDNPRVQEYLEVVESKAQRMKTLAESLMEASRASSGNLKITWERIDMVQMLMQVYGEFQEQMEEKELFPVLRLVDPPAYIQADGKILWRVLDNLYTNVCKYAKPGTQVLIELQETSQSVVYTMKNVSAVPLRYSSEELMERFIRGEGSRTTEGSGLGLSIARSMTEQLHGRFELYSDEEIFRVRLIFPLAEK